MPREMTDTQLIDFLKYRMETKYDELADLEEKIDFLLSEKNKVLAWIEDIGKRIEQLQ